MYKVVRKKDDKLVSYVDHENALEYTPGEWISPKIGKIFVFETYDDAMFFLRLHSPDKKLDQYEIYYCDVVNPQKCENVADTRFIREFWDGTIEFRHVCKSPKGTYMCDKILLKKRVF